MVLTTLTHGFHFNILTPACYRHLFFSSFGIFAKYEYDNDVNHNNDSGVNLKTQKILCGF